MLVVTHSVSYLDVCDQLLLIAPGGKTAFNGPPDQVEAAFGTRNWADIFAKVGPTQTKPIADSWSGPSNGMSSRCGWRSPGSGRTGAHRPAAPVLHGRATPGSARLI
ncbi:ABC superfamily ATP binding cassette transporter, ABC domain protein [Mycobacterium xenopi 4042]|uniref:ABC superfamily ATP binding cassette transporter, ABC domain protein n=1 Tax=Mycobacterium xenopi 4042 TaxID=1299334 RepID=X7YHQ1_MYCXE|nr:ABC superfamily ATP binding cassette transporter, ABC domain protein [Mycobacterium xenopi 4042]